MEVKQKASAFAVCTSLALAVAKFAVGLVSGSMTVVSSGLDSLLDVFMSGMNLFAIRRRPSPQTTTTSTATERPRALQAPSRPW